MPGLGLLRGRGRARDVSEPSREALAALGKLTDSAEAAPQRQVLLLGALRLAASLLASSGGGGGDGVPLSAFVLLEAADMFVEQHDPELAGVPEGGRAAFLRLLMALWISAARALQAKEQLSAAVVPNWKYVLRRAVATGEQLAESWPSEAEAAGTTQALDVLQGLVDGGGAAAGDEASHGPQQYDAQAQLQQHGAHVPGGLPVLPEDLAEELRTLVRPQQEEEDEQDEEEEEDEDDDQEEEEEDVLEPVQPGPTAGGLLGGDRPPSAASGALGARGLGEEEDGDGDEEEGGAAEQRGGAPRGTKRAHGLMVNPPSGFVVDDGGLRSLEGGRADSPSLSLSMSFGNLGDAGAAAEGGSGGAAGAGGGAGWASSKRRAVRASDSRLELLAGGTGGGAAGVSARVASPSPGIAGLVGDVEGGLLDFVTSGVVAGGEEAAGGALPGFGAGPKPQQQGTAGGASMNSAASLVLLPPASTSTGTGAPPPPPNQQQQQQQASLALPSGPLWGAGGAEGEELSWNQSVDGMLLGEPGADAAAAGERVPLPALGGGAAGRGVPRMPSLAMITAGKGGAAAAVASGALGVAVGDEWLADQSEEGGGMLGDGAWDALGGEADGLLGDGPPGSPGGGGGGGGVKRGNSFILSPTGAQQRAPVAPSKLSRMS